MNKNVQNISIFLTLGGFLFLLNGCAPTIIAAATPGIIKQEKVNLANSTHASVDILVQQSQKRFNRQDNLVIVSDLDENIDIDAENIRANPELGKVIAGQMRTRFLELGYNIYESTLTQGSKNTGLVTGTYTIRGNTINVYVRMTNRRTGEVLGVHEYSLPLTYDIKKYMTRGKDDFPLLPHVI